VGVVTNVTHYQPIRDPFDPLWSTWSTMVPEATKYHTTMEIRGIGDTLEYRIMMHYIDFNYNPSQELKQ